MSADVVAAYGSPMGTVPLDQNVDLSIYDDAGITFLLSRLKRVEGVHVFRAGTARNIYKLQAAPSFPRTSPTPESPPGGR